jgi:HAD superfamily hydrolase (TIGR01509 family)
MAASALILDLDGTLWDSHQWFAALVSHGNPRRLSDALARLETGYPAARLLKDAGISETRFGGACRGTSKPQLYRNVHGTLARLAARKMTMTAVTNLPAWLAHPMLACHGLDELMGPVVTYGTTRAHKPHPAPLLAACERLSVRPDQSVWYVGDSLTDAAAAKAAGMSFAWVCYGYGDVAPSGPHIVLSDFAQVLTL